MNIRALFKRDAVLEYRPIMGADGPEWHWSLLAVPDEDTAIASGHKKTKGLASVQARTEARAQGYAIVRVRTVASDHDAALAESEKDDPALPRLHRL